MSPKLPSLPNLASLIKPDKLQAVYTDVESFVDAYSRRLPEQASTDLARDLRSLRTRFGPPVEAALRALLCEQGSLRNSVEKALNGGATSAIGLVVPLLVAQFALAPTVALLVATLAIKALATHGQKKLCAELSQSATDLLLPSLPAIQPAKSAMAAQPKRKAPAKVKSKTKKPAARPKKKSQRKVR